jgi:hypothetical protein
VERVDLSNAGCANEIMVRPDFPRIAVAAQDIVGIRWLILDPAQYYERLSRRPFAA